MPHCKNICYRYTQRTLRRGGIYNLGFKRCSFCAVYFNIDKLKELGLSIVRCPCCNLLLKGKPNKKEFREKMVVKNSLGVKSK